MHILSLSVLYFQHSNGVSIEASIEMHTNWISEIHVSMNYSLSNYFHKLQGLDK